MTGLVLELRSTSSAGREWPRRREGAKRDERRWIESLNDEQLRRLAAEIHTVDQAVKRKPRKDAA
jgi:hypothetical protein